MYYTAIICLHKLLKVLWNVAFPFPRSTQLQSIAINRPPSSPGDTSCQRCTDSIQLRFNLRFDSIILSWIESNPLCNWPIPKLNRIGDVQSVNRILTNSTKMLWIQMNHDFNRSASFAQCAFLTSKNPQNPDIHIFLFRIICAKWIWRTDFYISEHA